MNNNPISVADPTGKSGVNKVLIYLAKKGAQWAARNSKNQIKSVSREQAVKLLRNKKTVYKTGKGGNKQAKKLMQDAKPNKKVVKHDGHDLGNGKTGMDHFQLKNGDGSHVNVMGGAGALSLFATTLENSSNDAANSTPGASSNDSPLSLVNPVNNATDLGALFEALVTTLKGYVDSKQPEKTEEQKKKYKEARETAKKMEDVFTD